VNEVGDAYDEHGLAGVDDGGCEVDVFGVLLRRLVHGGPREVFAELEGELCLRLELVVVRVDGLELDGPDAVLEVARREHGHAHLEKKLRDDSINFVQFDHL